MCNRLHQHSEGGREGGRMEVEGGKIEGGMEMKGGPREGRGGEGGRGRA